MTIIIICAIIAPLLLWVICIFHSMGKNNTPDKASYKNNLNSTSSSTNTDSNSIANIVTSTDSNSKANIVISKWHRRFEIWDNRQKRNRRVWSVLYLCNSLHKIDERIKKHEHPTKKMLKDLANSKEYVLENNPNYHDISIAIRYCRIKYASNECDYELTTSDVEQMYYVNKLAILPSPIELW